MSDPLAAALDDLLRLTPEPPGVEEDPDDIVCRGEAMLLRRQAPITALAELLRHAPAARPDSAARWRSLTERDARWAAALERARRVLADRMIAARCRRSDPYR